jgi:NAD(P)-dependent dehydrogenase (short-subunit alcohol dehydrogenase family)
LGGVGKTSIAVEYAYRYRDLYAGVWWCPAETRFGLLSALTGIAVHLGAVPADEPDVEKAARAALRRLAERRATVLLIYDNVTTPEDIADLLPSSGAGVLLTSRFSDWTDWAEDVPLDVLPPAEAEAFLRDRAARPADPGAPVLAEALGWLPLALDHAAAFCKRSGMSFADYAARAEAMMETLPRGMPYPRSIAATFNLALDALAGNAPAEAMVAFLAHCAPGRIPTLLVEGALDDVKRRATALLALTELSLVRFDPFKNGMEAVTMHRLVQAVGRARAVAGGAAAAAIERVVRRLIATYPNDRYRNPPSWPFGSVRISVCEACSVSPTIG